MKYLLIVTLFAGTLLANMNADRAYMNGKSTAYNYLIRHYTHKDLKYKTWIQSNLAEKECKKLLPAQERYVSDWLEGCILMFSNY